MTAARSPARKTIDLAIWATVQPTAVAASAAVRVPSGKAVIVSGWPAAIRAARTRSTELPVEAPLSEGGIRTISLR